MFDYPLSCLNAIVVLIVILLVLPVVLPVLYTLFYAASLLDKNEVDK